MNQLRDTVDILNLTKCKCYIEPYEMNQLPSHNPNYRGQNER